ncbi:MAG: DMT family transporter [Eubacteriales bacterium]|nr:DMT family transporter [Eubacteriales bacterium]
MRHTLKAIIYAILAAVFYAINTPLSKILLEKVPTTIMAALLYLGAGLGVGIMYLFHWRDERKADHLSRRDLPYTIGMIVLDILAPIFLMMGLNYGSASNAALLGNFEIVATTLIALLIFREIVTRKLWIAILFITIASITLSFEGADSFQFSYGSLFVLLATACWGLENNCTRNISAKSTYQIVVLKGLFSGGGSVVIAFLLGEQFPSVRYVLFAMLLGFVAYGLSIFMYIRAQRELGAAKTSAYYAIAPFIGAFLSFLLLGEKLTRIYVVALCLMVIGTAFVILDTIGKHHAHQHQHIITHTHDGITHSHTITHSHAHNHYGDNEEHSHRHTKAQLEQDLWVIHHHV